MTVKSSLFISSIPFSPPMGAALGTCAALLVQQMFYWCLKSDRIEQGHKWVFKTHKEWQAELMGFDQKTIQRALSTLRDLGIVVTANFNKHRYDRTLWYRVDVDRLLVVLHEKMPMWSFCLTPSGQIVHTLLDKKPTPIPKTTNKTTEETPAVDFATEGKSKPRIKIILGKHTETSMDLAMKTPTSSSAILQQLKVANGTAPATKSNTSTSLQTLWRRLVPKHHPSVGMLPEMTIAMKGQLSHFAKALGSKSDTTMQYIIPNWIGFCKFVEAQRGLKKSPNVPDIGFVLKYCADAQAYADSKLQLIAKKKVKVPSSTPVSIEALKPKSGHTEKVGNEPTEAGKDEIASADFMLNWKPEDAS